MTKEILVPLDGSPLAEAVLPYASALARATSSSITLLRALPQLTPIEPVGGMVERGNSFWEAYQQEPEMACHYLAGVVATLRRGGVAVQTKVVDGDPATCILNHASANAAVQFIAMATHGRSGLGRLFVGSVAEKVVHASPVPVLLLRSHSADNAVGVPSDLAHLYRNILVPLDGSDLSEKAVEQARTLAIETDATVTLLSVADGPRPMGLADPTLRPVWVEGSQNEKTRQLNQYLFGVAQRLRSDGIRVRTQVESGDPAEEIMLAGGHDHIDLIVMATHGRGGLQRLWLGSVALSVVQGANRPVLLVRAVKRSAESGAAETENEAVGLLTR